MIRRLVHDLVNIDGVKRLITANRTLTRLFFEYKHSASPWKSPTYEDHRQVAFALLGEGSFDLGLDIGCGEGLSAKWVADRCKSVLAVDISSIAIAHAIERNPLDNVEYVQLDLLTDSLPCTFDYVFCAEVLYYLHIDQLQGVIDKIVAATKADGVIHLLHYRSANDDTAGLDRKKFGAKTIHEAFIRHPSCRLVGDREFSDYRVTILNRVAQSVSRLP